MKRKSLLFLLLFALIAPWAANAQTLFSEGFEGGSMPTGWTTDGSGTWSVGSGDYSTTTGAGLGTYNALIKHSTTGNVTKLITPEIDLSSVPSATLSFMHVQRSWAGDIDYLKVYYRTSTSGTWTQLVEYTGAVASWTTEEDIMLPNTSATYQLAFEHTDNYGYGVGLDQIVISAPSACPKPTLGAAEYISEEGASFQWTENGSATQWQLQYSTSNDFANPTTIERNGIPAYAITGLTPSTAYYVHVRSYCGDGEWSDWSNTVVFRTLCGVYGLPYAYSFEDAGDLECWIVSGSTSASTGIASASDAPEGSKVFRFHYSEQNAYLISPVFDGTSAGLSVTFQYMNSSTTTGYTEQFQVGYTTSATETDPTAFTYGETIYGQNEWVTYENVFPANTKRIAIKYIYTNGMYLRLDDFTFEVPSGCRKPTDLATGEVGKRNATISWTENGEATAWQVEVTDLDGGQVTTWNANATTYEIVGLTPGTRYSVRVNPVCDVEKWSDAITFTTEVACPTPSVTVNNITPTAAEASWSGEASSYNLRYRPLDTSSSATVILTAGDVWEDGTGYQMLLDADATAYGSIIPETGGLTSSGDASAATYAEFEYKIPVNADGSMTTTNVVLNNSIAIQIPAGTYDWCITNPTPDDRIWIASENGNIPGRYDDYVFEAGNIYEFTVSLGTSNDQVNLTVNGAKSANNPTFAVKKVIRKDVGEVKSIANVVRVTPRYTKLPIDVPTRDEEEWIVVERATSPYTIEGLDESTTYEVQVMAICGGEDGESAWSNSTIFTTPSNCDAPTALNVTNLMPTTATLNWTGYQDGYEVRYRTAASVETFFFEGFEGLDQELPEGWTSIDADGDGNGWYGLTGFGDYAHSGDGIVTSASYASSALTPDNWLVTPQIALKGTMKVYLRAQDPSWAGEHYAIYLSTTGNTVADFTTTLVEESSDLTGEYLEITADLSSYNGQLGYIAIRHFNCTDMFRLNVDDFGIYGGEIPAGEWIPATTGDLFADIIELDPETTYEWQVRGENRSCTNGEEEGYTAWSEMGNFTTPGLCDPLASLSIDELTATSITLSWTGYQESYNVQYRTPADADVFFYEDFSGESIAFTFDNFGAANNDFGYASGLYGFEDGTNAIVFFPDTELTSPQYLISNEMEPTVSGTTIEFGAAATATGCVYRLGFSSTDNSISSFTWSDDIAIENSYVEYEVPVGTKYFAIAYPETNPSDAYGYVVDFMVYANYVPAGEWITFEGVNSPFTIDGLTPETEYEVYVQGVCGEEEFTATIGGYFTTPAFSQTIELTAGWNWFSTYVELEDPVELLNRLQEGLGDTGIQIENVIDGVNMNVGDGYWAGDLDGTGLLNEPMYMIEVSEDITVELKGLPTNPENHEITLYPGDFSWIGFPCAEEVDVNVALAGLEPEEGDYIENDVLGVIYYYGEWVGDFDTMIPGRGYMYYSNSTDEKPLIFQTGEAKAKYSANPASSQSLNSIKASVKHFMDKASKQSKINSATISQKKYIKQSNFLLKK